MKKIKAILLMLIVSTFVFTGCTMKTKPSLEQASGSIQLTEMVLEMELFALDLTSCGRCVGSTDNIESAIEIVRPVLDVMGVQVTVTKIIVESEEQALQYKFVSSPTVRINGRDIVFDTVESYCEACTDLSGCDEGIDCRVWSYRGDEYSEAPVGLVVEAILREVFGGDRDTNYVAPTYDGVPENIQHFFRSKSSTCVTESCCSESNTFECQ